MGAGAAGSDRLDVVSVRTYEEGQTDRRQPRSRSNRSYYGSIHRNGVVKDVNIPVWANAVDAAIEPTTSTLSPDRRLELMFTVIMLLWMAKK